MRHYKIYELDSSTVQKNTWRMASFAFPFGANFLGYCYGDIRTKIETNANKIRGPSYPEQIIRASKESVFQISNSSSSKNGMDVIVLPNGVNCAYQRSLNSHERSILENLIKFVSLLKSVKALPAPENNLLYEDTEGDNFAYMFILDTDQGIKPYCVQNATTTTIVSSPNPAPTYSAAIGFYASKIAQPIWNASKITTLTVNKALP